MSEALIVIPARLQASRLPRKPLADICGEPMIVHVWRRAVSAGVGRVVVATDAEEIYQVVVEAGGEAVITRADHQSGSDRVFEAVETIDPDGRARQIVNLQGDLPTLDPFLIPASLAPLADPTVDIGSLAAKIIEPDERTNDNVVKVIGTPVANTNHLRALYFTRATAPFGEGPLYHHIGIYGYRREALKRFISLQPSALEQRERLEQLRALEAGMRIDVAIVDTVPIGVDTPADLERARTVLTKTSS